MAENRKKTNKKVSKKTVKKAERAAKKAAKKHPKVFWTVVAVLLVLAIVGGALYYFFVYKKQSEKPTPSPGGPSTGTIATGDLSIHFLQLGNKYVGDCTLIKIGDTEVLIDAGSRPDSAGTIVPYIREYCTDGILEYVIATHADQDHIAAFAGSKTVPGIFDSFECKTIIDFPRTDKDTQTLKNYVAGRDAEVASTEGAVHYTALQCWNETDGASRVYELAEGVTMNILYNYYYENKHSDENNYSVCMLLKQGDYNYLFTGDLEEDGEAKLVQYNELPHCKLFKGGHHGSKTSSTDALLSVIQPENICICTCAGTPEYPSNAKYFKAENSFPTQATLDRMGRYTANIYITSMAVNVEVDVVAGKKSWEVAPMNGNIVVVSNGVDFEVRASNNTTVLKDTEWFRENRVWNGV